MTELTTLCPKDEIIRVSYYNRQEEPLYFLTSPVRSTSSMSAQAGTFTLYEVISGAKGTLKAINIHPPSGWFFICGQSPLLLADTSNV